MDRTFWKGFGIFFWRGLGIICSGLWLIAAGSITSLYYIAVMIAAGSRHTPPTGDLTAQVVGVILLYLLLGIGPVFGFIMAMRQIRQPLGYIALISLAICAAFPFTWLSDFFTS